MNNLYEQGVFTNPQNILTQPKANFILNKFINPKEPTKVIEKDDTKNVILIEQISNTFLFTLKDLCNNNIDNVDLFNIINKRDLNYKYKRLNYISMLLFILILLFYVLNIIFIGV